MPRCPKCDSFYLKEDRFCGGCGIDLTKLAEKPPEKLEEPSAKKKERLGFLRGLFKKKEAQKPPEVIPAVKKEPVVLPKSRTHALFRSISVLFGTLFLLISLSAGFPYYLESKSITILVGESLTSIISVFLIIFGLLPNTMVRIINPKINVADRYAEVVIGLVILLFIIAGIEPEPPLGWWEFRKP